jgi:hypothetical protein
MINVCVCVKEREKETINTNQGRYPDTNNTPTTRFSLKCYYCGDPKYFSFVHSSISSSSSS